MRSSQNDASCTDYNIVYSNISFQVQKLEVEKNFHRDQLDKKVKELKEELEYKEEQWSEEMESVKKQYTEANQQKIHVCKIELVHFILKINCLTLLVKQLQRQKRLLTD